MPADTILHYERFGDSNNPPIVLLHGFLGDSRDWTPVMKRLASRFLCLAIDLPGHGKSLGGSEQTFTFDGTTEAIAQVLAANNVISSPIIGYSMGGRIALYLAVHRPRLCSALIVESATAGISDETMRTQRRADDDAWARRLEQGVFEEFLRTWYSQPVFSSLLQKPAVLDEMIKRRRSNDPKSLARALKGFGVGLQPPLWDRLSSLDVPVLLITGGQDKKYVDLITRMANRLPSATVVIHPNAGHNVHVEIPEDFADGVITFLSQHTI